MKCAKCGAEIQEDTIFCPECGSYIELKRTEEREADRGSSEIYDTEAKEPEDGNKDENLRTAKIESAYRSEEYTIDIEPASQAFGTNDGQSGAGGGPRFDWQANQAANYPSAGKPKKSKAPYIVMGIVGAAIAVTLIYLVITLTGADKAKSYVEKALRNTFEELAKDERGDRRKEILEGEQISQQIAVTLSEFTMSEQGIATDVLKDYAPISFSLSVDSNRIEAEAMMALTAMVSDMKPARLEIFADSAGIILGLPGLYENYLGISPEDIEDLTGREINPEAVSEIERQQEGIDSLIETLKEWYSEVYNDVSCEKTQTVKLDTGSSMMEAEEYMLSLSERNYARHMRNLPKRIKADQTFMNWYASMTSDSEAEYLIKNLEALVEESMVDSWVSKVVLCYVRISQNQVVEIRIPLDDGKKQEGELVFSFFGKENLGDDRRIDLQISMDGDSVAAHYHAVEDGEKNSVQLSAEFNGMFSMEMYLDGEYHITESEYSYEMKKLDIIAAVKNYLGESTSVKIGLSGSYIVTEAEDFTMPEYSDTIQLAELGTQEQQELILKILDNALERGYVPSAFTEQFSYIISQLKGQTPSNGVGDNGGGSLDGSEYLTYEEFVTAVKEIYGDIYSEEVLRQIYDSLYGDVEQPDTNTGSEEADRLFCEDNDLVLEIKPVDGFQKDEQYSSSYELAYVKNIEDTDQILLDYQITTEKMEENLEASREFQQQYYTSSGYTDITISEIQYGMINGFQAAWIEYHASDAEGNQASGFNAYVQIDDKHGCILDMYNLFGAEEVSLDLLMKCFQLEEAVSIRE